MWSVQTVCTGYESIVCSTGALGVGVGCTSTHGCNDTDSQSAEVEH